VIGSVWTNLGAIAAIVAAVAWAVLVIFLGLMLIQVFRVLESTKSMIDDVRKETVPLLSEVKTTVTGVNRELDRVDGMLESAGKIVQNAERLSGVIQQAVSSPLIKLAAFGAGASRAARRFRKRER
jgi:uncharacterized protein YoxC